VTGLGIYADGMVEHDGQVGEVLAEIDRLGIRDNTIIIYSTDNGAEVFTWPDGGTTMFRGEKNTQFEGGYRVPMMMSWPGVQDRAGHHRQRDRQPHGPVHHAAGRGGRYHVGRGAARTGLTIGEHDLQVAHRRFQPAAGADRGRNGRASRSSTGPMAAKSRRCATATGRRHS
jgi:hypothetical protein